MHSGIFDKSKTRTKLNIAFSIKRKRFSELIFAQYNTYSGSPRLWDIQIQGESRRIESENQEELILIMMAKKNFPTQKILKFFKNCFTLRFTTFGIDSQQLYIPYAKNLYFFRYCIIISQIGRHSLFGLSLQLTK